MGSGLANILNRVLGVFLTCCSHCWSDSWTGSQEVSASRPSWTQSSASWGWESSRTSSHLPVPQSVARKETTRTATDHQLEEGWLLGIQPQHPSHDLACHGLGSPDEHTQGSYLGVYYICLLYTTVYSIVVITNPLSSESNAIMKSIAKH